MKTNHDDSQRKLKEKLKNLDKEQGLLELNFYIQKKMHDYPNSYMEEIKKDIKMFDNLFA